VNVRKQRCNECFSDHSSDTDVALVEDVMGFYDGATWTAHLVQMLGLPIILVVDAYGMGKSAIASDKASCFHYQDNPGFLEKAGVELTFSALLLIMFFLLILMRFILEVVITSFMLHNFLATHP
jgi:cobyrinic acid a,c-diamide synthase